MDNTMAGITSTVNSTVNNDTSSVKKSDVSGKTVGNPKLSEKASKYYEQLKKKFSNMDFVLVSSDMKEQAKANAASYANPSKMVVLVDEEKIERMAEDENYRKQYEGIIANSSTGMASLGSSLSATGATVKGFGMQVNDNGTASYFAVLEKSSASQRERIEKKAEQKKQAKKAEEKKTKKEKEQERLDKLKDKDKTSSSKDDNTITITASSPEELLEKVKEQVQWDKSDTMLTDDEKKIGQKFDFSL